MFYPKISYKARMFTPTTYIQQFVECFSSALRKEKNNKYKQIGKKEIKLLPLTNDKITT